MNWYFLHVSHVITSSSIRPPTEPGGRVEFRRRWIAANSRDHLLEASKCGFDIVAGVDVVFDSVDEGGLGDSPRIGGGGRILAASRLDLTSSPDGTNGTYPDAGSLPLLAMVSVALFLAQARGNCGS